MGTAARIPSTVVWHDVECGLYDADLALWRELAEDVGGLVLDVGAGTGRVALDLARAGHEVVALDRDPQLLAALRERAGDLPVTTAEADARAFELDRRFALILAPMQLVQLLGGPGGRASFLHRARRHLERDGLLAVALADALTGFGPGDPLPAPDIVRRDGWTWRSQPVAVRDEGGCAAIERIRETVAPDGRRSAEGDVIRLDALDAGDVVREASDAGLELVSTREIGATEEHVGSIVVVLRPRRATRH